MYPPRKGQKVGKRNTNGDMNSVSPRSYNPPDLVTVLVASMVAIFLFQTNIVPYEFGTGDHHVILPPGLLRADASLYSGDYFVRNALMPNWFFEYLAAFSFLIGQLDLVFFLVWLFSIGAFCWANLIIAQVVLSKNVHITAVIMSTVQILGVKKIFGTASPVLEQALPHTLTASLAFLVFALWLRGDRKILYFILPFLPIFHVHVGTITLVLVLLLLGKDYFDGQRITKFSVFSTVLTLGSTLLGMSLRPIGRDPQEFAEICRRLLPHHCYAPSWTSNQLVSSVLFIVLGASALSVVKSAKSFRPFLLIVIGIPIFVISSGLMLDFAGDGALVDFARGNNLYRFAVIVIPFAYWIPMLILKFGDTRLFRLVLATSSMLVLIVIILFPDHGSRFSNFPSLIIWFFLLSTAAYLLKNFSCRSRTKYSITLCALLVAITFAAVFNSERNPSWPNTRFAPDERQRNFGNALRAETPHGELIAGDPRDYWIRMVTGVGYAVDCKYRPIGGGTPLVEFYRRLEPLGGYEEACNYDSFKSVSGEDLQLYAKISDARLLLLRISDPRIEALLLSGWAQLNTPDLAKFGTTVLRLTS